MQFKSWLRLQENIIVNVGNGESTMGKSRESNGMVEFSYASGVYHSSFEVWAFSEERPGYVKMSDGSATVVGIIKKTPIEPGAGADRAFIKSLTASLSASGLKPLPYKEGESAWMGTMAAAGVDKDHPAVRGMEGDKEFSDTSTPDMGVSSPNSTKTKSSMSFGRMSGSWAYFMKVNPGAAATQIEKIVGFMKNAAKPLVDNDIIEQYRVVRGWNYKAAEVVWSNRGKKENDDEGAQLKKSASYIKFLADRMLANHPDAKSGVLKYFRNSWDKDLEAQNTRVPIDDLRKYVQHYHSESPFLLFFLDAVEGDKDRMYAVMDDAAKTHDQDDAVMRYKELADEEYDYMVDKPRLFMGYALKILSMSDLMTKHASGNFEKFKREYEEAINDWLGSGEDIRPSDIEDLKKLAEYIDIRGKEQIDDAHKKIKAREDESKKRMEEGLAKKRSMVARGNFKYMVVGKGEPWSDVPPKYLDGAEVEVAELAKEKDIIDRESIYYAAHEKASEDAMANAEERKSETYGQERSEVDSDIDYEWDEYLEDRFEEGAWEGTPEEDAKKEIKADYWDDFVAWKVERLKKEEGEESWKYEPEPEDSDIWKIEARMAEEQAYEDGLVVMRWPDDSDDIEVEAHSRHFEKAREEVRKSLAISMSLKDEDGEPVVQRRTRVSFNIVDKDEFKTLEAAQV